MEDLYISGALLLAGLAFVGIGVGQLTMRDRRFSDDTRLDRESPKPSWGFVVLGAINLLLALLFIVTQRH